MRLVAPVFPVYSFQGDKLAMLAGLAGAQYFCGPNQCLRVLETGMQTRYADMLDVEGILAFFVGQ